MTGTVACSASAERSNGVRLRSVETPADLNALQRGRTIERPALATAQRYWSPLLRPARRAPRGHVELGKLCRVHPGQVTGCNAVSDRRRLPGQTEAERVAICGTVG